MRTLRHALWAIPALAGAATAFHFGVRRTPQAFDAPAVFENSIGMRFSLIPPGRFTMGSVPGEAERDADEGPRHEVALSRAYYLGVFEVTQDQYERLMKENPSFMDALNGGGPDHPVEQVSWRDANEFCRRLSERPAERAASRVYRLPTEAEWEYACRAGTSTIFASGNSLSADQACFRGDRPYGGAPERPDRLATTPVGSFAPNPFGLYDMHGNVWEWCLDGPREYREGVFRDPIGDTLGDRRAVRGGAWSDCAKMSRSANRNSLGVGVRYKLYGFRVLCEVGPAEP